MAPRIKGQGQARGAAAGSPTQAVDEHRQANPPPLQQLQPQPAHVPVQFQQHFQHPAHQQHGQHPQHHQPPPPHAQYLQQHALAPQHQHQHHQPLTMAPSMLMPAPVQTQSQTPILAAPPTPQQQQPQQQHLVPIQQAPPQQPPPQPHQQQQQPLQQQVAPQPQAHQQQQQPILPAPAAEGTPDTITIPVDEFIRLRSSITTFLLALGKFGAETRRALTAIGGDTIPDDGQTESLAAALAALEGSDDKKSRKRRTHDPNAPKRPLTPYFLYLQYARQVIAQDLGPQAPKGAVQAEGLHRWNTMNQVEKNDWNDAYQYNLRLYNAKVHAFRNGVPNAKDMSDDAAAEYANTHAIPMPPLSGDAHADPGVDDGGLDEHDMPDMLQADVDAQAGHESAFQLHQPEGAVGEQSHHETADDAAAEVKGTKKAAPRKRKGADAEGGDAKASSPTAKKARRGAGAAKSEEGGEAKKATRKKPAPKA